MDASALYEGLKQTGYPVTYREWKEGQEPALPYVVYFEIEPEFFYADNRVYASVNRYAIELYTANNRSPTAEAVVQARLEDLGLPYTKAEVFLEGEDMCEVLYTVSIVESESESVS